MNEFDLYLFIIRKDGSVCFLSHKRELNTGQQDDAEAQEQ